MNRNHTGRRIPRGSIRAMCAALAVLLASHLPGCATGGATADGSSSWHALSAYGDEPIAGDAAVLWLKGMSCPLCATNVDKQLKRLEGVKSAAIDLGNGTVTLRLEGSTRPSPRRLAEAVRESGFTLEKIESK